MKRVALAILGVVILGGMAHAGPYIVCFQMVPSGQVNYWGQPIACAQIIAVKEWERDSYYSPEYSGQRICPRGTVQRLYDSYHNIGTDLDLCP